MTNFKCECGLSFEMRDDEWPLTCLCGRHYRRPGEEPSQPVADLAREPVASITDAEADELFPGEDPSLFGNRLKAMFEAIGVPTCGGCERRRQWLNTAHEWIRSQRGS